MNWLKPWRRLAIYLRDGLQCLWCGLTVEDGIKLTLDHALPRSAGGGNETTNLFTCCLSCNASRANNDLVSFAFEKSTDFIDATEILAHIRAQLSTDIDMDAAKALLSKRRTVRAAVQQAS